LLIGPQDEFQYSILQANQSRHYVNSHDGNGLMNYLAHGFRFLDAPLYVAGTAVPDWLRVAAPRIRARARLVQAKIGDDADEHFLQLCHGIMQHHSDDDVFHASIVFQDLCEDLADRFRQLMPDRYDHRPGLLGHIVTELLLDNELARRDPTLLTRYYETLKTVDASWVQDSVNAIVYRPADRLAEFIDIFCDIKFLYDYADNGRLMMRLNQVIKRAQLDELDSAVFSIFDYGRQLLEQRADDLLASCGIEYREAVEPQGA
jgi:hypothetical protein